MSENHEEKQIDTDPKSLLDSLLSNPDAMQKISEIIKSHSKAEIRDGSPLKENMEGFFNSTHSNTESNFDVSEESSPTSQNSHFENFTSKTPEILSLFTSKEGGNSDNLQRQIALLRAIKPYLSEHRQALIDGFIRLEHLGEIFKKLT